MPFFFSRSSAFHLHVPRHRRPLWYNTLAVGVDSLVSSNPARGWVTASRRRALGGLLCLASSFLLANAFATPSSLWCFITALALALIAALVRPHWAAHLLGAAFFAFGLGWYDLRINLPRQSPAWQALTTSPPALLTVEATVLESAEFIPRGREGLEPFRVREGHSRFTIQTRAALTDAGPVPLEANLWVRLSGQSPLALRAGDRIRLTGGFRPLATPRNPGDPDPRHYAAQLGFLGTLNISSPGVIIADPTPAPFLSRAQSVYLATKDTIAARARAVLTNAAGRSEQSRALLLGLILGDFDPSQQSVRNLFARQGLAHVLSISGLHLTVMAGVLLVLLRLTGDRGWVEPALVALLVLGYLAIVPPNSPVVRSAAMILALLIAEAAGRRYDRLTILLWIGVGLLLWRPLDAFSIGFQLSLGLTACLFWVGSRAMVHLFRRPIRGVLREPPGMLSRLKDHARLALTCGLLCWSVSLPATIYALGYISPWSLLATLLATPLFVAMLWVGYIALWAGLLWPALASLGAGLITLLSAAAIGLVRLLDAFPLATMYLPPLSGAWAIASTMCALLAWRWARPRRAWWWCVVLLPLAWAGGAWTWDRDQSVLRITTFDVGDGSCHLITSGGEAVLWDSGAIGGGRLMDPTVRACRAAGAWRVPLAIITHPDIDHFGAILDAAGPLGIRRVLVPPRFLTQARTEPNGAAGVAARALEARAIKLSPITSGDELTLGDCKIQFLSPPADADWPADNEHSLIAMIHAPTSRGTVRTLMTGDAQDLALETLPKGLAPDILELPHHGSARPKAISVVGSLHPRLVLQSTGPRRLNDPRWGPVRRATTWMCTAERGAITTRVDPAGAIITQGYLDPLPTTLSWLTTPTGAN